MNIFTKQKQHHRHRKQTYGYQRGRGRERDKLGDWDRYTLPYVMWIANKYPLYGTGNSTQYSAMTYMGKGSKI